MTTPAAGEGQGVGGVSIAKPDQTPYFVTAIEGGPPNAEYVPLDLDPFRMYPGGPGRVAAPICLSLRCAVAFGTAHIEDVLTW